MTIEAPPVWLQGGTYPARIDRFVLAELWDEGVKTPTACKVSQRGAGANFSVDVAVGSFLIAGDDQALQGTYQGRITATENAAVSAAPGSNSRYDLVTLRVNDPNAGGNSGNTVTVVIVAGTPSASPVVPSLPASSLPLAVIGPIATATSSITNSLIHDVWTQTGPTFALSCRLLAGQRAPVGTLMPIAVGAGRVNGWLYCSGQAVSRSTYADLFAAIGTNYGVGDGSTTFNLPDLRDRVPVAFGSTFATVGATGGEVNHTLTSAEMPSHNHGVTDPGHTHIVQFWNGSGVGGTVNASGTGSTVSGSGTVNTASGTTGISINNAGSGGAHNNMPPYQVVAGWVIRT